VAGLCTGVWFVAVIACLAVMIFVLPASARDSKIVAIVPTLLLLALTFIAILSASVIASRRTARLDPARAKIKDDQIEQGH